MANFMAKLSAFFMMILYFFGSFGLGQNPPVTIHVEDAQGAPVSGVIVYYQYNDDRLDTVNFLQIGETDENGDVQWEDQKYGEQRLFVCEAGSDSFFQGILYQEVVTISRTVNETITLVLPQE